MIRQRGLPPGVRDTSTARSSPLRISAKTPRVRIPRMVDTCLTDEAGSTIAAPFHTVGGLAVVDDPLPEIIFGESHLAVREND